MVQSPTLPDLTQRNRTTDRAGTMKALVLEDPGQISVKEVAIPTPGDSEVVIQVTLSCFCRSSK